MIDVDAALADVRSHLAGWEQAISFVKAELASGRFTEGAARAQIEHFRRCAERVSQGLFTGPQKSAPPLLGPLLDGTAATPLLPQDPGWVEIAPSVRKSQNLGLSNYVELCRKHALLKLEECGVTVPKGVSAYQAVADAGHTKGSAEYHLGEIENLARRAMGHAAKGDVETALGLAFKLGIYVKEYEVIPHDEYLAGKIELDEDFDQGRKKGNAGRHRKAEGWKIHARDAAERIRLEKHGINDSEIATLLISRTLVVGKSPRTVRGAIKLK